MPWLGPVDLAPGATTLEGSHKALSLIKWASVSIHNFLQVAFLLGFLYVFLQKKFVLCCNTALKCMTFNANLKTIMNETLCTTFMILYVKKTVIKVQIKTHYFLYKVHNCRYQNYYHYHFYYWYATDANYVIVFVFFNINPIIVIKNIIAIIIRKNINMTTL